MHLSVIVNANIGLCVTQNSVSNVNLSIDFLIFHFITTLGIGNGLFPIHVAFDH